jgi:hypothetical protein
LASFVNRNAVSEIVIAAHETAGITAELYQQLINLLESEGLIREYTQVYESKTYRIHFNISRGSFIVFHFSRNNLNKLYLSIVWF